MLYPVKYWEPAALICSTFVSGWWLGKRQTERCKLQYLHTVKQIKTGQFLLMVKVANRKKLTWGVELRSVVSFIISVSQTSCTQKRQNWGSVISVQLCDRHTNHYFICKVYHWVPLCLGLRVISYRWCTGGSLVVHQAPAKCMTACMLFMWSIMNWWRQISEHGFVPLAKRSLYPL